MTAIEFGFGSEPLMKEVPAGTEAVFRFNGKQEQVETDFGKKYSFPITLLSHPSYPLLEEGPMNMVWQSKSACAKQLYNDLQPEKLKESGKYGIALKDAYNNAEWQLTRFDTGTYFLTKK